MTNEAGEVTQPAETFVVDDQVQQVVAAQGTDGENYRYLYVTRFSLAYDAACERKIGDSEIRGVICDCGSCHRRKHFCQPCSLRK